MSPGANRAGTGGQEAVSHGSHEDAASGKGLPSEAPRGKGPGSAAGWARRRRSRAQTPPTPAGGHGSTTHSPGASTWETRVLSPRQPPRCGGLRTPGARRGSLFAHGTARIPTPSREATL